MVLYFSGTGNSEYVAKYIAEHIQDETHNLFERIKTKDSSALVSERPWVLVVPTYAWRIPAIVEKWLLGARLDGNAQIYFVMTCGAENGAAQKYCRRLCDKKHLEYFGCVQIVMPENYIAMFKTPGKEEAGRIIEQAKPQIEETIRYIRQEKAVPEKKIHIKDRITSGPVNKLFYPVFVHAKKFYATDACVSCGLCEKVCPLNNIQIVSGRPVWGDRCTHCMACISRCPKEAVEYGKHSVGLPRYTCPE